MNFAFALFDDFEKLRGIIIYTKNTLNIIK